MTVEMTAEEYLDMKDTIRVARQQAILTYCKGDRIVVRGLVCPHCGSSEPSERCMATKKDVCKELNQQI